MTPVIFLLTLFACDGCSGTDEKPGGDGDLDEDGGAATEDGGAATEDGGEEDGGAGDGGALPTEVTGSVRVQLYTLDSGGDRAEVDWADTDHADEFPFGAIWITATTVGEDGELDYWGSDTIYDPSLSGDAFSFEIDPAAPEPLNLYATLDLGDDGVLSSDEPFGIDSRLLDPADPTTWEGHDITILLFYDPETGEISVGGSGGSGGGGGGGSGDGGSGDGGSGDGGSDESCTSVELSGTAWVTSTWAAGEVSVLLYELDNTGPVAWDRGEPVVDGGGASLDYAFDTACGEGALNLRGSWDTNLNGLVDPEDTWGTYAPDPDVDGNPVVIGFEDLPGLDVQIPFGDGSSDLGVLPFVTLNGEITAPEGGWEMLGEDSVIYAVALMFRPSGDYLLDTLADQAYDIETWTMDEWAGAGSLPFSLWVPADTVVYLWAYVDAGPKTNGIVNEYGEYVASGGDSGNGAVPTGNEPSYDYVLDLGSGG